MGMKRFSTIPETCRVSDVALSVRRHAPADPKKKSQWKQWHTGGPKIALLAGLTNPV
jgi:hypothetical protein